MRAYFKIIIGISVVALIFILRLAYLQLFTDRYALNAANTSIKAEYIIPQRGMMFDRNGKILVGNQPAYELSLTLALLRPDFDTLSFCQLVGISKEDFKFRVQNIKDQKYFSKLSPMTFMGNLSRDDVARIQERIFQYPAFNIVSRPQRQYEVNTSGDLFGYTNEVGPGYIKKDSLYYRPGDVAGMTGIELSYEKLLRGVKGVRYVQKDIHMRDVGPYKNGKLDKPVRAGDDLTLTIDYDLQKLAEEMLVNKHGAIVALDPNTGEILTMATSPDIDPHLFTGPDKTKNIYKLQMDTIYNNRPTFDRSVQAAYPPGSTFKLLTALSALQMGVLTPETTFPCNGGFHYRGLSIRGHGGAIPMIPSLQVSSNCYFTYAYLAIINKYPGNPSKGVDEWKSILSSFGAGEYLHTDIAVGAKGRIPSGKFYERRQKYLDKANGAYRRDSTAYHRWDPLPTGAVFNGMGQGDVLLTPMQMANVVAAIANRGWYYTPHVLKAVNGKPFIDPKFREKHYVKVDKKYFEPVIEGMRQVVLHGTAYGLQTKEFTQLAKTGTAQVPNGKDNSIFVLIAPAENPKIVVASVIENAGFGATWAGPASTLIAEKYITGEIKRPFLYDKMINASFMGEYKKEWIEMLKKKGWYEGSEAQKEQLKKDSIKAANDRIRLEFRQDSIQKLKTKDHKTGLDKRVKNAGDKKHAVLRSKARLENHKTNAA